MDYYNYLTLPTLITIPLLLVFIQFIISSILEFGLHFIYSFGLCNSRTITVTCFQIPCMRAYKKTHTDSPPHTSAHSTTYISTLTPNIIYNFFMKTCLKTSSVIAYFSILRFFLLFLF